MKTPQTNALYERLLAQNPGNLIYLEEMLPHARQMERERDQAREKYDNEATEHMLAINRICNERDEAREALMKIEDLFIDGTDVYADRETMGIIARAALEGAK